MLFSTQKKIRPSCFSGSPLWVLDAPEIHDPVTDRFEISGWIATTGKIDRVYPGPESSGAGLTLRLGPRPDVEKVFHVPATGFAATCDRSRLRGEKFLTLRFDCGGECYEIVVPVPGTDTSAPTRKRNKLRRIRSALRCPTCFGDLRDSPGGRALSCAACEIDYPFNGEHYDFLTQALRKQFDIVSTENVSTNQYDGTAFNLIRRNPEGLILDCGAGLRDKIFENVVNFEIAPYGSSDVLGVGERLPFADNTFDAVFSFAVLEHVKDPFTCARELVRVLKPSGILYCQIPFLVPLHGYPHHYYNMTRKGIENLFPDGLQRTALGTLGFGQPIFLLSWFLNVYRKGLPPEVAERFGEMKVKDLLEPGSAYFGADFVTRLSETAQDEISCCNFLIATKSVD